MKGEKMKILVQKIGYPSELGKRYCGDCPYCEYIATGHYIETVVSLINEHIKEEHPNAEAVTNY